MELASDRQGRDLVPFQSSLKPFSYLQYGEEIAAHSVMGTPFFTHNPMNGFTHTRGLVDVQCSTYNAIASYTLQNGVFSSTRATIDDARELQQQEQIGFYDANCGATFSSEIVSNNAVASNLPGGNWEKFVDDGKARNGNLTNTGCMPLLLGDGLTQQAIKDEKELSWNNSFFGSKDQKRNLNHFPAKVENAIDTHLALFSSKGPCSATATFKEGLDRDFAIQSMGATSEKIQQGKISQRRCDVEGLVNEERYEDFELNRSNEGYTDGWIDKRQYPHSLRPNCFEDGWAGTESTRELDGMDDCITTYQDGVLCKYGMEGDNLERSVDDSKASSLKESLANGICPDGVVSASECIRRTSKRKRCVMGTLEEEEYVKRTSTSRSVYEDMKQTQEYYIEFAPSNASDQSAFPPSPSECLYEQHAIHSDLYGFPSLFGLTDPSYTNQFDPYSACTTPFAFPPTSPTTFPLQLPLSKGEYSIAERGPEGLCELSYPKKLRWVSFGAETAVSASDMKSPVKGVHYSTDKEMWRAQWVEAGRGYSRSSKNFAVKRYGFWESKGKAIYSIFSRFIDSQGNDKGMSDKKRSKFNDYMERKLLSNPHVFVMAAEEYALWKKKIGKKCNSILDSEEMLLITYVLESIWSLN